MSNMCGPQVAQHVERTLDLRVKHQSCYVLFGHTR